MITDESLITSQVKGVTTLKEKTIVTSGNEFPKLEASDITLDDLRVEIEGIRVLQLELSLM